MSRTRQDVEKVALLARLRLAPSEVDTMTRQLSQIVDYVQLLSELNTDHVQPLAHAIEVTNVFAADQPLESLSREEALSNAPHTDDAYDLVPPVLGS